MKNQEMRALLGNDIKLQWRQGFWLVYFVLCAIYVLVLLNIPRASRVMISMIMILSDTTMLGAVFMGALILLEKQQGIIHSLFVTPLKPDHYIWSKVISLSLIAVTMSILIYLPSWNFTWYSLLVLLVTAVTAGTFALLGLAMASGVESVNQYFGTLLAFSVLIAIPEIPYLILDRHPLFLLLPCVSSLDVMLGLLEPLPAWRIALDMVLISGWGFAAYRYCRARVNKKLVMTAG
jgi:fluoroquinolone transport system permease protein